MVIIEQANTHNIAKHQTPPYSRVKCFRQSKCLHNTTCNEQDNSKLWLIQSYLGRQNMNLLMSIFLGKRPEKGPL